MLKKGKKFLNAVFLVVIMFMLIPVFNVYAVDPPAPDLSSIGCNNAMDSVKIVKAAETTKLGDVNTDGVVDAIDMVLLKKHLLGVSQLSGTGLINADINKDGYVDASDIVILQKYLLGIIKL